MLQRLQPGVMLGKFGSPKLAFRLDRLRHAANLTANAIANLALFFGIVVFGGVGSSWYMIDNKSALTTRSYGPWVIWTAAGRPDADPYTRARFARIGSLPLSATVAQTYEASTDKDGERLHSSCEYRVEGRPLEGAGRWFSLAVYNDRGRLIPNPAERYAYTSDTMVRGADGSFTVALARDARSGNWLPTGGAGRLQLIYTVIDQGTTALQARAGGSTSLPFIRKLGCR